MRRLLPLFLLAACKGVEVAPPAGPDASVLVARVGITGSGGTGVTDYPRRVLFARLREGSDNPLEVEATIWSNYWRGSLVYLFNAPPGRYVMTCAVSLVDGKEHYVFLPREVVEPSLTEVKPRAIAVMASAVAHQDRVWSEADEIQRYFHGRVLAKRKKPGPWARAFPRLLDYRGAYGRFRRNEKDDRRTEKSVRKLIRRWGWDR